MRLARVVPWLLASSCVSTPVLAQLSPRAEIVFLCNRKGVDNICAINPATSEIRQITNGGDPTGPPRWSPDHRMIAYHQRRGSKTDVFIMNSDGTNVRKITESDGAVVYRNPSWSPDGSQLAIECGKAPSWDICVISVSGTGSVQRLTRGSDSGYSSESPDWSPDGRRIAFQSNRDATPVDSPRGPIRGYDVYTMTVDGRDVRRLSTTPAGRSTLNPAWSPDGKNIVVASTRDGGPVEWDLFLLLPDGSSMQAVTHDRTAYGYGHPRWSRDGRFFVFHSNRHSAEQTTAEVELYLIGSDGTGMRRLTNNHEYDGFADW
jgi:TolB protein